MAHAKAHHPPVRIGEFMRLLDEHLESEDTPVARRTYAVHRPTSLPQSPQPGGYCNRSSFCRPRSLRIVGLVSSTARML